MNIVIIEDETLNSDQLSFYINKYDANFNVVGVLKSNKEITHWFSINPMPTLVLSDIRLLDGTVFTSLQNEVIICPIIFTTAFNEFYQEAFDSNGIAYLLKPISYKSFSLAMDKFKRLIPIEKEINWPEISKVLMKMNKNYRERIIIKTINNTILLEVKNITCISTTSGVCQAIDNKGKSYEFRQKFSDLVEDLNPEVFFQINRGEMVNINFIESIEPYFTDRLSIKIINTKKRFITSNAATPEFRKWLER